jgi:hypothetical protein
MEIYPKKNENSTLTVEKYFKSQVNSIPITNEKINIISDSKFLSRNLNFPKIEYPGILEITVIGSQSMSYGTKIKIDKMGLIGKSLRNIKSNITYFGFIEDLSLNNENNENSIDYLIPQKKFEDEETDNVKFIGRFFRIYFNTKNLNFYLRDLGNCLGTYVKVKESIILKNEDMINVGDTYLIFNFENDKSKNNTNNDIINIQIAELNKNNESQNRKFSFNSSKKIIRIGRKKYNNDIELDDHLVSKVNCNIQYDEKNGWKIKDGNEIITETGENKITSSTNGTWILAIDDFLIYDNMIFKSNLNLFRCNFSKQN